MAQFMKLLVTIALTFAVTTAIIITTTTITNPTTEKFAPKDPFKDLTSPEGVKIRPSRFLSQKDVEGQEPKARNRNEWNVATKIQRSAVAPEQTLRWLVATASVWIYQLTRKTAVRVIKNASLGKHVVAVSALT
ncbi:hypothetical protein F2Q70_00007972 [Brassica cretica]|uniref:Uncharacterized protein n=1 Tax=Brassica cretica TaxID=69181 RepID=A0A8S9M225_BRACR|nr:hypothetical protein F2Q70_00007972 [Brassica cretica]